MPDASEQEFDPPSSVTSKTVRVGAFMMRDLMRLG
ncbi:hypothetical protein MNBD_GAMMA08-465 [hydrothermal vent metagenome]|uniref:Uncharacterized protein n=1 Tax=hydrothermal vent metagenome TaxID=652676 RepID=A0A3B0Y6M2_9ZZZZ